MRVQHVLIRAACLCLAAALSNCSNDMATPTMPSTTPVATPPTTGSFGVGSSNPAFGGTVFGPAQSAGGQDGDYAGTTELVVPFQMTYSESIPSFYFVVELLHGQTECLRTQIAYCNRTDGNFQFNSYAAGSTATFRCPFFVRDNWQPSCGPSFTTDRIRFILQDEARHTLFVQEVSGGWTFKFML